MGTIYTKKFNWLPTTSAWQSMKNWREKHRAYQEQADQTYSTTADTLSTAITDLGMGMAEIAAKQAAARVNAAAQEKLASVDLSV